MENKPIVIALGYFDGVHLGHGALLRRVTEVARQKDLTAAAFTFDAHPASRILGRQIPQITGGADKAELMRSRYGIEKIVVGNFDEMERMPWQTFVTDYLKGRLGAVHVVAGHDFRFGYRGEGSPARLRELCVKLDMGCDIIERVELDGVTVSSTYIRTLIAQGEIERAAAFLGHPHVFTGRVIPGKQLGRRAGFPTANLKVTEGILVPARGVYATRVRTPDGVLRPAVTNVGIRPTVDDGDSLTVESWILDYDGDLYDRDIRVEYHARLREERKFSSVEELTAAVFRDAERTRAFFSAHPHP